MYNFLYSRIILQHQQLIQIFFSVLQNITSSINCGFTCNKLWDGHGAWRKQGRWKSYVKNTGIATVRFSSLIRQMHVLFNFWKQGFYRKSHKISQKGWLAYLLNCGVVKKYFKAIVTAKSNNFSHLLKIFGSSRPEVYCKKAFLKNFSKFTGKYLCWSLFLIEMQA